MNKLKIVALDRLPLDPGDMDWSRIAAFGELSFYDRTDRAEAAQRIDDADVVLTNKVPITAEIISGATGLRMVSVLATGYDVVDVAAARERGVAVCNVPGYSADFTAQTALALLLELTHHAGDHSSQVRDGAWSRSKEFAFWSSPLVQLAGKTAVIVGLGNIGRRVADILSAFRMRVIAAQLPKRDSHDDGMYERLPLDEALAVADVVSLHTPLNADTRALLNGARLAKMKHSVLIVNGSRGGLVNEADIADALRQGTIGGYACDVLSSEPPSKDNPLLTAPRCIITPHLGWAAPEPRARILAVTADNIQAWLNGKPQNLVS